MSNNYKISISFLILISILFFGYYIKNFRIDASSDTLIAQNDKDFIYYNYYKDIFPTKDNLVIAIKSSKKIDKKLLNEIELLSNKILELKEVSSVFNINQAPILFLNNTNLIDLNNGNIETILNSKFNIKDILNEFTESPIYKNQIINHEQNTTSLLIYLNDNEKNINLKKNKEKYISNNEYYKIKSEIDNDRHELILKIRNIIKNSNQDYKYYLGGVEMISNDVINFVKKDIIVFSILVLIVVIIILFVIFSNIKWVLVTIISSLYAVYITVGLVSFFNYEITAVSANFISLMFILSVSMNIHIINSYIQNDCKLKKTLKLMFWPCFYTFLTTIVAFFSLLLSDIKPVIDFGIIMIFALTIVLVNSFTTLPLLISYFPVNKFKYSSFKFIDSLLYLSSKYSVYIILINIIFFSISILGIISLNVENSFIKYFKKNTEIYQGMKLIDTELGGTTPLDIIIKFNSEDNKIKNTDVIELDDDIEFEDDLFVDDLFEDTSSNEIWFTSDKIKTIKEIHNFLENRNEIGKVISIYSLIDVANQINKSELNTFELSILYDEIPEEYKINLIYPYLSVQNDMVRIAARVRDSQEINRSDLISEIDEYISKSFENISEYKTNGLLVLYNNMLSSLFSSQIKSLGFVLLAIFLMFIVLFKSIKLSIIGIIPNIFASSYILGLIGLLKIPLDIMTITIAAISIGIAVDNTIHYLYRYQKYLAKEKVSNKAIESSHKSAGKAVLITSCAISMGFLVLSFSNFIPTIIFGIFTSLAMIFAMIGVLITLPSILNLKNVYKF